MPDWYLHSLYGRVRVRVASIRGLPKRATLLEAQFSSVAGVELVCANPVTGNVLIRYAPDRIRERDILHALGRLGWLPPHHLRTRAYPRAAGSSGPDAAGRRVLEKVITALLEIVFLRLLQLA